MEAPRTLCDKKRRQVGTEMDRTETETEPEAETEMGTTYDVTDRLSDASSGHGGQFSGHTDNDQLTDSDQLHRHHVRLPLVRVLDLCKTTTTTTTIIIMIKTTRWGDTFYEGSV